MYHQSNISINNCFSDALIENSKPNERPKSAKKKSPPKPEPSPPPAGTSKKDDKSSSSLAKLDDLPSLGGLASRKQQHKTDFDDFGFEDDFEDSAGASSSNKKPPK